ncbi:CHAT domain-containing protein, partial [Mycena leptocephala]
GHPEKSTILNNLSNSLLHCFEQFGDLNYLKECITKQEDAVRLTPDGHPDMPLMLHNLGNSLLFRFERLGDLNDINDCISKQEDAVHLTPDGHPDKPSWLSNLGYSLLCRFEQLGDLSDINESISKQEYAVSLTPDGHPEKPGMLKHLGNALRLHFQRLGDLSNINDCISKQEDAVGLTPDGHPDKPSRLSDLGSSLICRFERLGDLSDINEGISKLADAVLLTPDGLSDKLTMLQNLGNALLRRFQRFGDLSDINECISKQEDAVRLTPDGHPEKPARLTNLGTSFELRFQRLGELSDLNESITKQEDAVHLTPDGHPLKPLMLINLSDSLLSRFKRFGDLSDLNECISKGEDAVQLTPDGHPDKPAKLTNLGTSLRCRFDQLGDLSDLNESISKQEDASTAAACSATGPVHVRLDSAKLWAHCAQEAQHSSLLTAFQVALDLLSEVVWLGLSISDRHHQIMKAGFLVRDAAAAAISSGQLERAVEWLEQGRSIIWGQLLNLRTPVDELQQKWPELATELIYLSAKLDRATTGNNNTQLVDSGAQQSLRSIAHQAHEDARKRNVLLKKIRQLPGFQQFLLPKTFSQLSPAAQKGPVVFLNVSQMSCDGLILQKGHTGEVMHVPFHDFTPEYARSLARSFEDLMPYRRCGDIDRLHAHREGSFPDLGDEFAWILSELWVRLVKPVLDALAITTPTKDNLPRIWWCPTGPLTFLPIHAAGLYGKDVTFGSKLSDFVISSYTPSLAALIQGFCPTSVSQHEFQLLVVAQPSSVGQGYIPGTKDEIQRIQQCAKGKVSVHPLVEQETTVANVEEGMMKSSWVHFACHGVQEQSTPTDSALLLAGNSRLTLERIIKLSLPHANLAFLSACQTATGDKELQDESVHLAAGMLLAGYRGVIATMWSIMDNDAPQVAADVYEHLFKISPPDPTQAAEALHLAIRNLCESSGGKKSFIHWVPFIHVG